LPKGYVTACAAGTPREQCKGPMAGEGIWMKRVDGKFVDNGKPAYGVTIWESESKFQACGSKLGFTYDDAKNHAGIDLSGSGINEGEYNWASGWADGWKSPTATLMWSQTRMENGSIGGYAGQKQYFKQYQSCTWDSGTQKENCTLVPNVSGYMFNAQSDDTGCRVDGIPYQLNDWKDMKCDWTDLGNGLNKNKCTKIVDGGKTATCVNIGGQFLADGTALRSNTPGTWFKVEYPHDFEAFGHGASCPNGQYPMWQNDQLTCSGGGTLTPGDSCSTMRGNDTTDASALAQLRCYADAYHKDADAAANNGQCIRQVQTNWMAQTPDEFIIKGGPDKAQGQHIFEAFEYDSETSGSFRSEERHFEGIKVGDNWDSCEVIEALTFSMRKDPASTDLITEMIMEQRNVSSKPACVAYYEGNGDNAKVQKMMFKMKN